MNTQIDQRPKCAVRGLLHPRAMCSMVIVGGTYCGHAGPCEHKIEPPEAAAEISEAQVRDQDSLFGCLPEDPKS